MFNRFVLAAAIAALTLPGAAQAAEAAAVPPGPTSSGIDPAVTNLNLFVGQVKLIAARDVTRIALGNGKLVTSSVLHNQILMLAEGPGDGSMHVWFKDGSEQAFHIHVSPYDTQNNYLQIAAMLQAIPGTKVARIGDQNVITGETSKDDAVRVAAVAKLFPDAVNMTVEEDIAMKKMVYMKVQIIEYNTNALRNLGLDWSQSFGGPNVAIYGDLITNKAFNANPAVVGGPFDKVIGTTVNGLRGYSGMASIITSQINLALDSGDAFMVASPELSARSGGEAKFLAGGEIPLVSSSANGTTVTYKEYGIKLEVKPLADDKGNVVVAVKTEISSIDSSTTVTGGYPGFLKRSSESVVNVTSGQTVALSGLVNDNRSQSRNGLAGLSQIPLLGALFRTDNKVNNRRELVIFVTPLVADPASEHNQNMIKRGAEMEKEYNDAIAK